MLYLIKERQPRQVYQVDLSNHTLLTNFDIPNTESNDFSDAKFEKGHLYLLERNGNLITKINPESQQVVKKLSYKWLASHEKGKLYEPTPYGMAEALLLTEDEIWIGLDNNYLSSSSYGQSLGIEGISPVIIRFKRPTEF